MRVIPLIGKTYRHNIGNIRPMPIFTFKAIIGRLRYQSDNIVHPWFILTYTWFYITKSQHVTAKCKGKDQPRRCFIPCIRKHGRLSHQTEVISHRVPELVCQSALFGFPSRSETFPKWSAAPCSVLVSPAVCCHRNGHQQRDGGCPRRREQKPRLWVREL